MAKNAATRRRRPIRRRPQRRPQRPQRRAANDAAPAGAAGPIVGGQETDDNPVTSQRMDGGCYSKQQIGAAMILTGWEKQAATIAAGMATTTAESGRCRVCNHHPSCGGRCGCWGPWQLNPDNGGNSAIERCAAELICSTQEALRLFNEGGWGKWAAYSPGSASDRAIAERLLAMDNGKLREIVGAEGDLTGPLEGVIGDVADAVTAPLDALKAIVAFIARLFEPSFWLRVGKVIIGAVALIIGTSILARAMLGVDLGLGERTARAVATARAAPDPGPGPSPSERRKARRQVDKVLEDNPALKPQRPLDDEPPF